MIAVVDTAQARITNKMIYFINLNSEPVE